MKEQTKLVRPNLTQKQLQKLFKILCIHKKEYREKQIYPFMWENCEDCILRDVPWNLPGSTRDSIVGLIVRDLCFAIWHEGILK